MTNRLLALVAIAALALAACSDHAQESGPQKPATSPDTLTFPPGAAQLAFLRIQPAIEAPVPLAEPLNARIAYDENVTARVGSPVAGRVVKLYAEPGDSVKAGGPLLALDSPDLAAALAEARKAEADAQQKRKALDRAQRLFEADVSPRKDLDTAESDFKAATAELERTRLRLRNLRVPEARTGDMFNLPSPISGVVAERKVTPGMEVRPDAADPLFIVTDPSRLWVMIDLPELYLSRVKPGQLVLVEVDAYPGERFSARIERVAPAVDPVTRRIAVRAKLANPDGKLKPEMFARAILVADEAGKRAVQIPNSAIVTVGLYPHVFVETAPGTFVRRKVKLLVRDREWSYLEDGLSADEHVVVQGAMLLNSELGQTAE